MPNRGEHRHLDIDIAHKVVPQVVAHIHLFNLPVLLLQFREDLLRKTRQNSTELQALCGRNSPRRALTSKKLS